MHLRKHLNRLEFVDILCCRVRERQSVKCVSQSQPGSDIDDVIIAVFADLIWHTQSLREEINAYGDDLDFNMQLSTTVVQGVNYLG